MAVECMAFERTRRTQIQTANKPYKATVSIVTPVYNENPQVFKLHFIWKGNKPSEIIAVIDHTDKTCIQIFKDFAKKEKRSKLIITKSPKTSGACRRYKAAK
jgi:cellulose synthase/poly-beta-1,6-N-acetylglucosamine synthase-like glycosyltransferase